MLQVGPQILQDKKRTLRISEGDNLNSDAEEE